MPRLRRRFRMQGYPWGIDTSVRSEVARGGKVRSLNVLRFLIASELQVCCTEVAIEGVARNGTRPTVNLQPPESWYDRRRGEKSEVFLLRSQQL